VQLYQDDLEVVFDLFRDTSFKAKIVNKSVGVNINDMKTNTKKELIFKHMLPQVFNNEEVKGEDNISLIQLG
jgi:hypothetical protein